MKIKICIEPGCKNAQTVKNYCRLHYLKNWKDLREEAQRKAAARLNNYVEGICKKNPEKYVDAVRRDIRSDREETSKPGGEFALDETDLLFGDAGLKDESLDKLISSIKIDKDY